MGLVMPKEKIINIRVDSELKRQARRLAENDGRSLSNWILRLIKVEIEKSGKHHSSKKDG
jgi:predicted HicB family RNase H-like nuclease